VEVHPNGAQNGIEPVARHPVEAVAVHSVFYFHVPDSRLARCTPFQPPPQTLGGPPAVSFVEMELNLSRISMAPVSPCPQWHARDHWQPAEPGSEHFSEYKVPMSAHGTKEPTAAAGSRLTDFATKLKPLVRIALADALHMRLINTIGHFLACRGIMKMRVPIFINDCS
jgi:hypothetical protein